MLKFYQSSMFLISYGSKPIRASVGFSVDMSYLNIPAPFEQLQNVSQNGPAHDAHDAACPTIAMHSTTTRESSELDQILLYSISLNGKK